MGDGSRKSGERNSRLGMSDGRFLPLARLSVPFTVDKQRI